MKVTTEKEMVHCILDFLKSEGYRLRVEVPNMGQSVDIVATKGKWITLVEAKLNKWKRALEQCEAHNLVADYVCVGIGSETVSDNFIKEAEARGVGIIHCSTGTGNCTWVVPPERNENIWMPQRKYFASNLKRIEYAC